jgi:hypothetical protein
LDRDDEIKGGALLELEKGFSDVWNDWGEKTDLRGVLVATKKPPTSNCNKPPSSLRTSMVYNSDSLRPVAMNKVVLYCVKDEWAERVVVTEEVVTSWEEELSVTEYTDEVGEIVPNKMNAVPKGRVGRVVEKGGWGQTVKCCQGAITGWGGLMERDGWCVGLIVTFESPFAKKGDVRVVQGLESESLTVGNGDEWGKEGSERGWLCYITSGGRGYYCLFESEERIILWGRRDLDG